MHFLSKKVYCWNVNIRGTLWAHGSSPIDHWLHSSTTSSFCLRAVFVDTFSQNDSVPSRKKWCCNTSFALILANGFSCSNYFTNPTTSSLWKLMSISPSKFSLHYLFISRISFVFYDRNSDFFVKLKLPSFIYSL
jgi:hypothetical protein